MVLVSSILAMYGLLNEDLFFHVTELCYRFLAVWEHDRVSNAFE